jgi:hypothetical protein
MKTANKANFRNLYETKKLTKAQQKAAIEREEMLRRNCNGVFGNIF